MWKELVVRLCVSKFENISSGFVKFFNIQKCNYTPILHHPHLLPGICEFELVILFPSHFVHIIAVTVLSGYLSMSYRCMLPCFLPLILL